MYTEHLRSFDRRGQNFCIRLDAADNLLKHGIFLTDISEQSLIKWYTYKPINSQHLCSWRSITHTTRTTSMNYGCLLSPRQCFSLAETRSLSTQSYLQPGWGIVEAVCRKVHAELSAWSGPHTPEPSGGPEPSLYQRPSSPEMDSQVVPECVCVRQRVWVWSVYVSSCRTVSDQRGSPQEGRVQLKQGDFPSEAPSQKTGDPHSVDYCLVRSHTHTRSYEKLQRRLKAPVVHHQALLGCNCSSTQAESQNFLQPQGQESKHSSATLHCFIIQFTIQKKTGQTAG